MNAIKLLKQLVRTPSISGQEEAVAGEIRDSLLAVGVDKAWIDKVGNVVARISGGGGGILLLEGHMDTVGVGDPNSWHVDPFSAKIIDKKLYGRGATDMKGGIASQITALSKVKELDIDIYLIYTVLEEVSEGVALRYGLNEVLKDKLPNSVVTGEATQLNLGLGHRGRAVIKAYIHGITSHAALPNEGINSLIASAKLIGKVNDRVKNLPSNQLLGSETIVPTEIECSPKGLPQTPDLCVVTFDYRIQPGRTKTELTAPLEEVLNELLKNKECISCHAEISKITISSWRGFTSEVQQFFPGWINSSEAVIKELLSSLRKVYTYASRYFWRFGTDLTYTSGILGLPGYGLGPGNEKVAHTPDEYVEIDEVLKAVDEYVSLIKAFNKVLPNGFGRK